jgi:hypothetical protein
VRVDGRGGSHGIDGRAGASHGRTRRDTDTGPRGENKIIWPSKRNVIRQNLQSDISKITSLHIKFNKKGKVMGIVNQTEPESHTDDRSRAVRITGSDSTNYANPPRL